MASAAEKMEALAYWVAGSILCVTCALLGTPIWSIVIGLTNGFNITSTAGINNLHAVQSIPMEYYGFLVIFEVALILRTVFVVWSRTTYDQTY
jgi:hypothetical protein